MLQCIKEGVAENRVGCGLTFLKDELTIKRNAFLRFTLKEHGFKNVKLKQKVENGKCYF